MAYQPLIKKFMDVCRRVEDTHCANVALGKEMLVMTNRLTDVEIALIEGGGIALGAPGTGNNITIQYMLPPEGYAADGGSRVAPVTLVEKGGIPISGAAITAVISDR